jgi:hypothetical protein
MLLQRIRDVMKALLICGVLVALSFTTGALACDKHAKSAKQTSACKQVVAARASEDKGSQYLTGSYIKQDFRRNAGISASDNDGLRLLALGKRLKVLRAAAGAVRLTSNESFVAFQQLPQHFIGGAGFAGRRIRTLF